MIAEVTVLSESNIIFIQDPTQPNTIIVQDPNHSNIVLIQDPYHVDIASFGVQGIRGFSLLSGEGSPITSAGINQDLYMDIISGFIYKKLFGTWVYQTYLRPQQKKITISSLQFFEKQVTLYPEPSNPDLVTLEFLSGGGQENGIEFNVVGDVLSWDGLGLDGFIEIGDIIIVRY